MCLKYQCHTSLEIGLPGRAEVRENPVLREPKESCGAPHSPSDHRPYLIHTPHTHTHTQTHTHLD